MEIKDILKLITAFDESTLAELEFTSEDQKIVLRRGAVEGSAHSSSPASSPASLPPAPSAGRESGDGAPASSAVASIEHAGVEPSSGDLENITSPIVGTFYRSPSPDAPPFAEEGSRIDAGAPLCILEAMKVMNELQAEFDLEVVRILVENGDMVEFGSPIFEVRRR